MTELVIDDADAIAVVLASEAVAPPSLAGAGATIELRNAMARFAPPGDHADRRRAVVAAVNGVDVATVATRARELTAQSLEIDDVDAVVLACRVPVVALASTLGLIDVDDALRLGQLLRDVESVVDVIGRGAAASLAADAATNRLLTMAADHPCGAVPVVSLLYQCYDATAALITTTLDARSKDADRVAAVPRTRRAVLESCSFDDCDLVVGDALVLEIGSVGLEFGTGPHACPGETIARAIADAAVGAIAEAGYEVVPESVGRDPDARPTRMRLRRHRAARHP